MLWESGGRVHLPAAACVVDRGACVNPNMPGEDVYTGCDGIVPNEASSRREAFLVGTRFSTGPIFGGVGSCICSPIGGAV